MGCCAACAPIFHTGGMKMNVFELFGTIAIKNRDANAKIADTTQKAERSSARIQAAFKKIGEMSIKVGKVAAAIGTAFVATAESTRDYRTAMVQLDTAFNSSGHSAETAKNTYKALQAVLGDTDKAVEAATALALMCEKEEDLAKWTEICTGVFATHQDKLPIEGLTEAANETAKVGVVTGQLADALNWVGISEDDFNLKLKACRTEQERQELIMNTLYWKYKQAADQYMETGKSVMQANAAQEKLNAAMAKLGAICEPVVSMFKSKTADMVVAFLPLIEKMVGAISSFSTRWEQFARNLALGYDDMKKSLNQLGLDLAKGWDEIVLPHIKEKFKVVFGVDMPSWSDIASRIQSGWQSVLNSIAGLFNISIGYSVGGVFGGGTSIGNGAGRSFAKGLDYVPYDNFEAYLHRGEAVLTRKEAEEWRGNGMRIANGGMSDTSRIEAMLNDMNVLLSRIVSNTGSSQTIMLDSGILAGQLAPAIDARLGTIAMHKGRGN